MLVNMNNNKPNEEKDWLAIGQKEYKETNPFGYKDYKETYDNIHWFKTVEYTDENGKKVVKEINPFGQVFIHQFVKINEGKTKIAEKQKLEKQEQDDFEKELKESKEGFPDEYYNYDWDDTPEQKQDEKSLSENDFFKMDLKEIQYQLYRLLLNISSSLSNTGSSEKE